MKDDFTQEAIGYIRGIKKAFRYGLPASFMDELENFLNKWDKALLQGEQHEM